MATATLSSNGTALASADSSTYQIVEGNVYFPPSSLQIPQASLVANSTHSTCPWKGEASYYDLKLDDGTMVHNVGWFYPEPKSKAENIRGFIAWDQSKVKVQK